jgi:hypothetical protein
MSEGPRHRGPHLRRAGTGLLALLALAAVVQSWNHFSAGAVPRSNVARRVADLADVDDPASGPRLALAEANLASLEFTDVRVAEADAVPESRPTPPAEQTSSEEASVDIEPAPELTMAQAPPEMATSPVDPGEADVGSAVEDPQPQGEGPLGDLAGTSGDGGQGPLSGIGGGLGPLIGIIGGIALGGGSGPGPFIVLGGGSGCEGTSGIPGTQLPGPIAAGPRRGEFVEEGPGPLGGNPTSGAPTIRIPTTVPADPSGIIASGGRGFVPEAPDLGRTNDSNVGSGGTPFVAGRSAGNAPATAAAITRVIEEASRSFGTRSTRSSYNSPATRQLQGSSGNTANPASATMRERVQRALVRPTESRAARPPASRQLQPSVRTTPTRNTSRAAQVRPSAPNRATRVARPAAAQTRASGSAASAAARRAAQTRASSAARPTRALPSRRSQQ